MTFYYTNVNAPGEITELDERNTRLDALDNWTRHDTREAAERADVPAAGRLVVHDGVLSRAGMQARRPTIVAPDDEVPDPLKVLTPVGEQPKDEQPNPEQLAPHPATVERPADRAAKAEWVAYAVHLGAPEDEAKALTRDELVDAYGQ